MVSAKEKHILQQTRPETITAPTQKPSHRQHANAPPICLQTPQQLQETAPLQWLEACKQPIPNVAATRGANPQTAFFVWAIHYKPSVPTTSRIGAKLEHGSPNLRALQHPPPHSTDVSAMRPTRRHNSQPPLPQR
jgi:hypothetical protein